MNSRWSKKDRFGQVLIPGDLCVYDKKFIVYKGETWGGSSSKREFGRFITPEGARTIKYTNVIFAFDPMGKRRSEASIIKDLTRRFYEGEKR